MGTGYFSGFAQNDKTRDKRIFDQDIQASSSQGAHSELSGSEEASPGITQYSIFQVS